MSAEMGGSEGPAGAFHCGGTLSSSAVAPEFVDSAGVAGPLEDANDWSDLLLDGLDGDRFEDGFELILEGPDLGLSSQPPSEAAPGATAWGRPPPGQGSAVGTSAAGLQYAVAATTTSRSWRCLHQDGEGHGDGCTRCTPPPLMMDESLYELIGEQGKKNGEKRLRSLILRTPEWADRSTCRVTGEAAEREGGSSGQRLASLLRAHRVTELRKRDLLFLCRSWGYRSCLWALKAPKRGGGGAGSVAAAQQQTSGESATPPRDSKQAALSTAPEAGNQGGMQLHAITQSLSPGLVGLSAEDAAGVVTLALGSIRSFEQGTSAEAADGLAWSSELRKAHLRKHACFRRSGTWLASVIAEAQAATKMWCTQGGCAPPPLAPPGWVGPLPASLVFRGQSSPLELILGLATEFLGVLPRSAMSVAQSFLHMEQLSEARIGFFTTGAMLGVQLLEHLQVLAKIARRRPPAEYLQVMEQLSQIVLVYARALVALTQARHDALMDSEQGSAPAPEENALFDVLVPKPVGNVMKQRPPTREELLQVALTPLPGLTLFGPAPP